MAECIHAFRNLDECAEVEHADNLTMDNCAHGETVFDIVVRVIFDALVTKRNSLLLTLEVLNVHLNDVTDGNHLGRVLDAVPGQFGDVDQSVHAADVDECAEVGQAADDTIIDVTDLDAGP